MVTSRAKLAEHKRRIAHKRKKEYERRANDLWRRIKNNQPKVGILDELGILDFAVESYYPSRVLNWSKK